MNYRNVLEKYKQKLELSSRGNSKELRLNKQEITELYQAMTSLLLINAELKLTNEKLQESIRNQEYEKEDAIKLDGGRFK